MQLPTSYPVFRKGDRVVFSTKAIQEGRVDPDRTSLFLVEEVVSCISQKQNIWNLRLRLFCGSVAEIHPSNLFQHVEHVEPLGAPPIIPVTMAPGFLGNPDQWCWWETNNQELGAIGGYRGKDELLADIARLEQNDPTVHFHVTLLDDHGAVGNEGTRDLPAGDVRRRGRGAWSKASIVAPANESPARDFSETGWKDIREVLDAWSKYPHEGPDPFANMDRTMLQHACWELAAAVRTSAISIKEILELASHSSHVSLLGSPTGWMVSIRHAPEPEKHTAIEVHSPDFFRAVDAAMRALAIGRDA